MDTRTSRCILRRTARVAANHGRSVCDESIELYQSRLWDDAERRGRERLPCRYPLACVDRRLEAPWGRFSHLDERGLSAQPSPDHGLGPSQSRCEACQHELLGQRASRGTPRDPCLVRLQQQSCCRSSRFCESSPRFIPGLALDGGVGAFPDRHGRLCRLPAPGYDVSGTSGYLHLVRPLLSSVRRCGGQRQGASQAQSVGFPRASATAWHRCSRIALGDRRVDRSDARFAEPMA